jgi:prefoldin subunit 5
MLNKLWIALAMTLVVVSSYSQYPQIKKIKDDSVVIMTIKQGNEINALYVGYNKTIDSLKNKSIKDDSLLNVYTNKVSSLEHYKYRYQANLETYQNREREIDKMDKYHAWQKIILIFLIVFQFNQL